MNTEYSGKNYIITGGTSGIGRCICLELSYLGANVALIARNQERLRQTYEKMSAGNHAAISFDVNDISGISGIIDNVYVQYGTIDGFVHCVGSGEASRLSRLSYDKLHAAMLSGYYAFVEFVRCVAGKRNKAAPLRIVSISSAASVTHAKHLTAYAAAKSALEAATRTLSAEFISKKVTVNAVRPAYVRTARLATVNELTGDIEEHLKRTGFQPQGLIEPEDAAKLAIYLLGDAAKSITGMVFSINGGAQC
ncbi:MAG: SDR family oxidoreductase [Deltaproteobacteria bacterium]|nr:SDR family oxidoreductase [Deltaproteobacteria bacterium]